MTQRTENRPKATTNLRETAVQLADRGMFLSLVMAGTSIVVTAAGGEMPHWAAFAGAAVSAAYLLIPKARSLALGDMTPDYPRGALLAARTCALRAHRQGDDGIWAIHDKDAGTTEFKTEFEFRRYVAALPRDVDLAVIERVRDEVHVKRYVGGVLQSGDDCAAHEVYGTDGRPIRAIDYDRGEYGGMRSLDEPMPSPMR